MERIGFDLPKLTARPANEPFGYGASLTSSTQAVMDSEYVKALTSYYDRAEGWIETETMKRQTSLDPKSYIVLQFAQPVPQRELVTYNEFGSLVSGVFAPVDPRIPRPTLPPLVESSTGPGFKMATPPDQVQTSMLGEVLRQISILQQKVDRLAAK